MQRLQAIEYELRPNGEQQRNMRHFAGSCRVVFNKTLALQKTNHDTGGKFINNVAIMAKHLTAWRNGAPQPSGRTSPWLADTPVHLLQLARQSDSFRYPVPMQIKLKQGNSRIFLPKLSWMRYCNSRSVFGAVRNVTVSLRADKWRISIQTARLTQAWQAAEHSSGMFALQSQNLPGREGGPEHLEADRSRSVERLCKYQWSNCKRPSLCKTRQEITHCGISK